MLPVLAKVAAPMVRAGSRSIRSVAVRKITAGAGQVVPSAKELRRTRELYNVVDDRLTASLKGVTDAIGRLESHIVKLENQISAQGVKMDMQVARLESKIETQAAEMNKHVTRLEDKIDAQVIRLESKMDKFATKEYVKDAMGALEVKLRNYLLVGAGSLVLTGAAAAARAGFFSPQETTRHDRSPGSVVSESTASLHPK